MKMFLNRWRWHPADLVALGLALYIIAWAIFDVRWYFDLQSVTIADTEYGEVPEVDVVRYIHENFPGRYLVTIREAEDNSIVCSSGWVSIPYRENTKALKDKDLLWWAEGGDCTTDVPKLLPGDYIVETCHEVVRPWRVLPSKRRCVESELFTITPPKEAIWLPHF